MKRFIAVLLTLVLLVGLSACGGSHNDQTITVVLDWTPNTNHTGIYVALANGYFEEAGLNVQVVQPPEDGAVALVASGKAQFGVSFQDSLAPAFAGDSPMPVTAVAALIQHNTSGIVSRAGEGMDTPRSGGQKVRHLGPGCGKGHHPGRDGGRRRQFRSGGADPLHRHR
jgi:ABC-type nitrate/sulfonate/bicarbonate transport system substrate-binding protein